jgi:hypothetical protein
MDMASGIGTGISGRMFDNVDGTGTGISLVGLRNTTGHDCFYSVICQLLLALPGAAVAEALAADSAESDVALGLFKTLQSLALLRGAGRLALSSSPFADVFRGRFSADRGHDLNEVFSALLQSCPTMARRIFGQSFICPNYGPCPIAGNGQLCIDALGLTISAEGLSSVAQALTRLQY